MKDAAQTDQVLPNLKDSESKVSAQKETRMNQKYKKKGDQKDLQDDNSEFAKKSPLIPTKIMKKLIIVFSLFFLFLIVGGIAFSVYSSYLRKQLQQPAQLQEPPAEQPTTPVVAIDVPSQFAYIKNENMLLSANLKGEERTRLIELTGDDYKLTTLYWKDIQNLTYSRCPIPQQKVENVCNISTLNVLSKSITPELNNTKVTNIYKLTLSSDNNYLAYIGTKDGQTYLYFQSGTVNSAVETFLTGSKLAGPHNRVFFAADNQYVIYATKRKDVWVDPRDEKKTNETTTPMIYVYRINGVKVDEIRGASDPFLVDGEKLGYVKDKKIVYRTIGNSEETVVTSFTNSYNPVISEDGTKIAYWKNEGGFQDVVLGLYESSIGIHRNIIRGIVLPAWITEDSLIGITADKCVGQNCFLYEFQTTSLALVDINKGTVITVDQGRSISELTFNK